MDRTGRSTVLLEPGVAVILAENLPEEVLEENGWDVESVKAQLMNIQGGAEAPRDLKGIEQGFSSNDGNERTGVWGGSGTADPADYQHGYARGR
jgi:hypothetical protein